MTSEGHFSNVVTLCAQLTRDLLAIAKLLVIVQGDAAKEWPTAERNEIVGRGWPRRRSASHNPL